MIYFAESLKLSLNDNAGIVGRLGDLLVTIVVVG